jgi:hypothetical protein
MKKFVPVMFSLLMIALAACAQEMQVPVDSTGRVPYIDASLERKLRMFTEVAGFQEARLYQAADSSFTLEISSMVQNKWMKERRPMTADAVQELRRNITMQMFVKHAVPTGDQDGRAKLLATTTTLGAGFYGWGIPLMTDMEGGARVFSTYLLTSCASFFVPYFMTQHKRVTDADGGFAYYGGTRGIVYGILIDNLIEGESSTDRSQTGFGMLGSVAGLFAGYHIAEHAEMTPGTVGMIATCGDLGLIWGGGVSHLGGYFAADHDEDNKAFPTAATMTPFGVVGLATGAVLANTQTFTRGDVAMVKGAIYLGAAVPIATGLALSKEDSKTLTAAGIGGSVAGVVVGNMLVRNKDFTSGQGALTLLSTVGGVLGGMGLTYAVIGGDHDAGPYAVAGTLGGILCYGLAYSAYSPEATANSDHSLRFDPEVTPAMLTAYRSNPGGSPKTSAVPGLKVTLKF